MESNKFLVGISCITYNQRNYIVDTMNGFAMQQTNFPFVAVIVDDASTDGEPEVISNYLEEKFDLSSESKARQWENEEARYVYARHKENKNCYFAVIFLKTNYYSKKKSKKIHTDQWLAIVKYLALCEGDDYWTHPQKLQKQVDFLESHPDYTMCFHSAVEHWEDGRKDDHIFSVIEDREYSGVEVFDKWIIATASVVLRKNVLNSEIYQRAINNPKFIYGDIIIFLCCCHCGKIWGMSILMCVYRRHNGSMTASFYIGDNQLKFAYHCLEVYHVFGEDYKESSLSRFFSEGIFYYFNPKETQILPRIILLSDLFRIKPMKTVCVFKKRIRDKVHIRKMEILSKIKKWKALFNGKAN